MYKGLAVIDVQNDFARPDGSLFVPGGWEVAHMIHDLITGPGRDQFKKVYATKDWHNPQTMNGEHFSYEPDFVDTWPFHCVANTTGSDLAANLDGYLFDDVFHKGWDKPAYSGFEAVSASNGVTGLSAGFRTWDINDIVIVGIASTHCVKASVLDALDLGYNVEVWSEYTVGVNIDGTGQAHRDALAEMKAAGAVIL